MKTVKSHNIKSSNGSSSPPSGELEGADYKNYLIAKGYSTDTTKGMLNTTNKFLMWINEQTIEIATINYNDITAFIKLNQSRGIKARTTQIIVIHVKHYLNYLVEAGILSSNPALALKLKNTKRKTVYDILSLEELETIYKTYKSELPSEDKAPPQTLNKLARKRNKIVLGLLIYQGIATEDIKNLEIKHLELREGKITIPGTKRSNERILKLESHQIFDLYDYVNGVRKEILNLTKKQSTSLFISIGTGSKLQNSIQKLVDEIRENNKNVSSLDQVRASIITNWLKQYNKRKVQYMAGHRYVSSTEHYEANNIDSLQEDIQRFYPVF
jgi:site-specific recombinase XerD